MFAAVPFFALGQTGSERKMGLWKYNFGVMLDLRCFKAHFGLRQAVFRFCLRSSHFIDLILLHSPCRVNRNRELWYRFWWTGTHLYERRCSCLSLHYLLQFLSHIIRVKLLKVPLSSVPANGLSIFGCDISHPS